MKKIRNIRDLENERVRLRVRELELEKRLDRSWKELKNNFSTNNLTEQKQPEAAFNFRTGNALLNGALNFGATFLSHRVGLIAGRTIENAAEQILGRLSQKINSLGSKKKRSQKS